MFGFSVFMNEDLTAAELEQMTAMASGFKGIFTSMHIPEDDRSTYRQRLTDLGGFAKDHQLSLMVDISGNALAEAGFSIDKLAELREIGVTGLRMDYAIDNQQIAAFSKEMTISLNASTLTEKDIRELQAYGADFTRLEAWHNYYPRPETGLDADWFQEKNRWLRKHKAFLSKPLFQEMPRNADRYFKDYPHWKDTATGRRLPQRSTCWLPAQLMLFTSVMGWFLQKVRSSLRRICKKRGSFCGSKILVRLTLNTY